LLNISWVFLTPLSIPKLRSGFVVVH
jgi:hypothetical protein